MTIIKAIEDELEDSNDLKNYYELHFSSIERYLSSIMRDSRDLNIEWPNETGDFWEYNYESVKYSFWTGYFTTHPDFKRTATAYSDFAQSAQHISVLSTSNEDDFMIEQGARFETLSIM